MLAADVRRRGFRSAFARREVEVELEGGVFGMAGFSGVRSCSAFDPPTAITCPRRCLDSAYRNQWWEEERT
ncbi:MAG: hypothetical protein A2X51_10410 [Candidatus Rokubacteria bacterium GWC2_70_24]|nr:MAG: hypothetical protein A2X53_00355 [Candidatus Rokubacteria bacterium GWA2_70_23]OGK88344.1 MAG: hypothetical protein A2X51_10410 [Candidatus Rokubacteria bacterium GWC2_70_24]OGK89410.1 MAG: hypothetical protein A2X50_10165 [Candidatus Rokubacteria bacterium GWF2_70_14]HAM59328.1 hypothetical protein [Candidatus Rokubacteria bacterium]